MEEIIPFLSLWSTPSEWQRAFNRTNAPTKQQH
jgi:hypothetical protein